MSRSRNNLFTEVPVDNVKRNHFDLSHEVKMSCKFGFLYPVLLMDTMPGDDISDTMTVFARLAPMQSPVMHRVDVTTHFFFVPNRLVSNKWEDFITGGQDGLNNTVLPYITPAGIYALTPALMQKGSLWDYFGLPVSDGVGADTSTEHFSALPFRAYAKIWNDYYRDPNFDDELDLGLDQEGAVNDVDTAACMVMRRRGWEKDYFTAALPWPQRGADVLIPISGVASGSDIVYDPVSTLYNIDGSPAQDSPLESEDFDLTTTINGNGIQLRNISEINVDNAQATINDLRLALALQSWLETNARGGGRYIESIQAHFNQRVPDYRLQRAEYLGGGMQPITISEVLSTSNANDVPIGDLAGHGISVGKTNHFRYHCAEHGFVIGIMSVMPRTAYQQGIPKLWSRTSRFQYGWPQLAHLGEQEIISKEIFYSFDSAQDPSNNVLFGYIPRYSEYKFMSDRVAGDFRDTLAFWHLGRIFTNRPSLDEIFTTMYEDGVDSGEDTYRRIFAVEDGTDYIWCQLFHRLHTRRPLPYFGVPQI